MTQATETPPRSEAAQGLRFVWLADRPEAAEIVAGWTHEAWGREAGRSFDEEVAMTLAFARRTPPMMLLAVADETVIGSAALRLFEAVDLPEYEHWLSAVFVAPEARGRGIASRLVEALLDEANRLGIERIYLRTEDLTGGLYRRHGFEPVTEIGQGDERTLVMARRV